MDKDTISVTSGTPKSKGGMGRYSTEERIIRGSPSSSTSSGKQLPNYLRASTGSCHDFCKYGKKQAFEEETKHQFHRKLGKSKVMGQKQLEKEIMNEDEGRKKILISTKGSSFQSRRVATSDAPEIVNRLRPSLSDGDLSKEKPVNNEMLPQDGIVLTELTLIPATSKNKNVQKIRENMDDRKTQIVKSKAPMRLNASKYKSDISTEINEQNDLLPDNVSDPQRKSIATKEKNISGMQKVTASIKPRLVRQTSEKSHSISYKPEISKKKSLAPLKTVVMSAKPDISLKAIKTSAAMPESPLTPSYGSSTTRKDGDKTSRYSGNPKVVEKRGLKPSRTSPKMISHSATTTKNKDNVKCKKDEEKVEEKIVYVSEMKPNDADMKYLQKEVQKTHIAEEIPLPENGSLSSLEKELLTPQNVNACLQERENVDLECQQKKSNNDHEDETDNSQRKQQSSGDQSFPSVLDDKEESDNCHQQLNKDDQSSQLVLDSIEEVANCHQQKLSNLNQTPEDDLSSQSISEIDGETDNFQQHKSSDSNQTSTDDHSESDYEDTDESDFAHTESGQSEVEYEESESINNDKEPQNEERRKSRRSALVPSEDSYSSPHKLKFRRGKVIELQPESNGPKRLRFRRARVVSDGGGGGGSNHGSRHLRRNVMNDVLPDDPNPEAETVVLRHKDAQEKKDSQGLFNNVIEETASKLVETRKSKVKALVGAFETVISLQDGKATSTT